MRILVVENHEYTLCSIENVLKEEGMFVMGTCLGQKGLEMSRTYQFDAMVLDLKLTDISGYDIIKIVRSSHAANNKLPILVISGLKKITDKVAAFEMGADDFLMKPFDKVELIVRIKTIVRRCHGHAHPVIKIGNLVLNTSSKTVAVYGELLRLTRREYEVLELMVARPDTGLTKLEFMQHLYDSETVQDPKILDVFVCKLRKKLEEMPNIDVSIETVWGRGYKLKSRALATQEHSVLLVQEHNAFAAAQE